MKSVSSAFIALSFTSLACVGVTSFHYPSTQTFLLSTRSSSSSSSSSSRPSRQLSLHPNRLLTSDSNTIRTIIMSTNNENEENTSTPSPSTGRRRRTRKDGKNKKAIEESSSTATTSDESVEKEVEKEEVEVDVVAKVEEVNTPPPPPPSKPVQLQVMDVRDVVSGVSPKAAQGVKDDEEIYDDEEYDDDDEYEYYYEDEDSNEVVVASGSRDSSLETLLADAKRMRKEQEESGEDEDAFSIPSAIRSVISNIITVDFFVVCALLAWFLAGIFCSYIIKDDTVQIAFNGIFEPVVQPALGVLMIGSAAGAVFNDEEKEE